MDILIVSPDLLDATSFYRAVGPLSALRKQVDGLSLSFTETHSWATMAMTDIVFMHRPYSSRHLEVLHTARDHGKKIWVDYDDNLFDVPPENPAHELYAAPSIQANIANLLRLADAVTLSTPQLKRTLEHGDLLRKGRMPCTVIPNAFDDALLGYRGGSVPAREKTVLWRGSPTHRQDLLAYKQQILECSWRHRDWTWHFIGDNPGFLRNSVLDNAVFSPPQEPVHYFRTIYNLRPTVLIVPLQDCEFNRAKSNIAWMEAIFAGGVALGPDWDEWRRPGCVSYSSPADFKGKLELILSGGIDVAAENARGWRYIQRRLRIAQVNRLRVGLIDALVRS